ncbi:hypothetical protein UA08_02629 [Talaromyces atroroseus]|uniref:Guanine nucleotide-exchange factor SEC12 n=1 Tax=Talaromyces atroroseus TaxID=1441469 RepID=A0A225AQX4_TALAT|nr:hypothetical protein UA08_02629 [Talaromyces atroroseus]OKL61903.1 hypothetical protein UA08_02629 [Talaromyces atroroseus]
MAPLIASSKITLSCPLFAADFDPQNHGLLLVGGGGGEGRSGVGNRITLLNTSKRHEISELVDIQLSRDEDSVTSLAVAGSTDESMVALAGINSSQAEQLKGNNQHLRSFRLEYPPRKGASRDDNTIEKKDESDGSNLPRGKTTPLSQVSLFRTNIVERGQKPPSKVDTYQRLLRLSPYKTVESPRIGAIATGLAPWGEIVLFNATSQPQASDVIGRIRLANGEEAEDVDILELDDGKFLVAYTNGTEVFTFEILSSRKSNAAPEVKTVFTIPKTLPKKSKYRALRFLSPTTLLLLQNTTDRSGCELSVLSLPTSRQSTESGTIIRRKKLRKSIKIGLSLDVINLGEGDSKERQYLIALAGSDQSIETLTLDYLPRKGYGALKSYASLKDAHPFSMTKVCFSHYRPPAYPVTGNTPPQYVKLASISLGNTVVVHTFTLYPQQTLAGRDTTSPRYALKPPGRSDTWETIFSCIVALAMVAFACLLTQAYCEIRGITAPTLGATDWLPDGLRRRIGRPYTSDLPRLIPLDGLADVPEMQVSPSSSTGIIIKDHHLREFLIARNENNPAASTSIDPDSPTTTTLASHPVIIRHDTEGTIYAQQQQSQHPTDVDIDRLSSVRKWEDLHPEERRRWRHHLEQAGLWALEEGEQVFQGILFGQIGGFIADAI